MNTRRAVILDRDGTILHERHYLSDPKGVELLPGAAEGLRQMALAGFDLVVITNQSGIGRGYFDNATLGKIHHRMEEILQAEGVRLTGIYCCPHRPDEDCPCRKPKPGLILDAAKALRFNPEQSYVIGDKRCDIELGHAVKAVTLLVRTGYGAETERDLEVKPHLTVNNLVLAAEAIMRREGISSK